jgi:phosphoserine phosphatase
MSVFVFDLDGTLIDSSKLSGGRKTSWEILELDHPLGAEIYSWDDFQSTRNWSVLPNVQETLSTLLSRGHQIVIATRAPMSYASTILHLARIGYSRIYASCGPYLSKSRTLHEIADFYETTISRITYIGDLEEDQEIAESAGAKFITAKELWEGVLIRHQLTDTSSNLTSTGADRWSLISEEDRKFVSERYGLEPETTDSAAHYGLSPIFEQIVQSFKDGIPNPRRHSILLFQSLKVEWESGLREVLRNPFSDLAKASKESRHLVAGLATLSLLARPGSSERATWQLLALASWESGCPSRCLIQCDPNNGVFQLNPAVLSRYEIDQLLETDEAFPYLRYINSIFPIHHGVVEIEEKVLNFNYLVKYGARGNDLTGFVLSHAKNYHFVKGSGPEPILGLLDFVSDICASAILRWLETNVPRSTTNPLLLIPVPSNTRSHSKPAEVSNRLVFQIAARLQSINQPVIYAPVIIRNKDNSFAYNNSSLEAIAGATGFDISHSSAILVDDQCTNGTSIAKAHSALEVSQHHIEGIFVFSKSRVIEDVPDCSLGVLSRFLGLVHECP